MVETGAWVCWGVGCCATPRIQYSSVHLEVHCCIVWTIAIAIAVYNEWVTVGSSHVSRADDSKDGLVVQKWVGVGANAWSLRCLLGGAPTGGSEVQNNHKKKTRTQAVISD